MTASASVWQPAISYWLTGALVALVVASSTPPDAAVHQPPLMSACSHGDLQLSLLTLRVVCVKPGNMLCVFHITEGSWLHPQIASTYHWVTKCLHRRWRSYKVKQNGSAGIYSTMQRHPSISLDLILKWLSEKIKHGIYDKTKPKNTIIIWCYTLASGVSHGGPAGPRQLCS